MNYHQWQNYWTQLQVLEQMPLERVVCCELSDPCCRSSIIYSTTRGGFCFETEGNTVVENWPGYWDRRRFMEKNGVWIKFGIFGPETDCSHNLELDLRLCGGIAEVYGRMGYLVTFRIKQIPRTYRLTKDVLKPSPKYTISMAREPY